MKTYADLEPDQLDCIAFIDAGEDALVCADVGTGKTVISLTAAKNALAKGTVTRWLVLAPTMVAEDTWRHEPREWEHLQNLDVAVITGDTRPDQRINIIEHSNAQVIVTNYENLSWLLSAYPKQGKKDPLPFDGLICDEIDKLKEVSSGRFKDFRDRINVFRKRVGLTGTLIPNRLTELWGSTYMVDGGQTFGRSFYKWRQEYFYPTDYKQYKWAPFPATEATFIEMLDGLTFRLRGVGLPEVVPVRPVKLELHADIRRRYYELEKEFYLLVEDTHGQEREINAANAAVLQGKLQQICAGFSYVPPKHCKCGGLVWFSKEKQSYLCHECKSHAPNDVVWHCRERFAWLESLCTSLSATYGEQLLVFYHFKEELKELKRRYPGLAYLGSGVPTRKKRKHIEQWNAGKLDMLALHPASAGHGLNLQKSGAHHIVFLTLPWSGGMYQQVVGRLARRGQIAKQVFVHTALFRDTVDEVVFDAITSKVSRLGTFLDELEKRQAS